MVVIDQDICIGCGLCVKDCVVESIAMEHEKATVKARCISCGHCVAICPQRAVSLPEYEMDDVEEYDKSTFNLSPEQFLHAVKFRRSVRDYQDKKVEPDKINRILNAGVYTETAVNSQGVKFVVVQNELEKFKKMAWEGWLSYAKRIDSPSPPREQIEKLYEIMKESPKRDRLFFNAPAVILVASQYALDGGLASANMEMMAVAEGLGMMFDGYLMRALMHNEEAVEWLGLKDYPIVSAMLMGYPAVTYRRTAPRKKGNVILM